MLVGHNDLKKDKLKSSPGMAFFICCDYLPRCHLLIKKYPQLKMAQNELINVILCY